MFQVGDAVSYGTNGVCTIAEKKKVCLAGQPCECYILKPVYDRTMKICVPCDSQVLYSACMPCPASRNCWIFSRNRRRSTTPIPKRVRNSTGRHCKAATAMICCR